METNPELLLRMKILEEYRENAIQVEMNDLMEALKSWPGVWWNAYSQKYGVKIKPFPYEARNGFFIDVEKRLAIYRFESKGIIRRDRIFSEPEYAKIVLPAYRERWFDENDATRCYAVLISNLYKLETPIPVENFGLYNSWGRVSGKDQFHHPRPIKATWRPTKDKNQSSRL